MYVYMYIYIYIHMITIIYIYIYIYIYICTHTPVGAQVDGVAGDRGSRSPLTSRVLFEAAHAFRRLRLLRSCREREEEQDIYIYRERER